MFLFLVISLGCMSFIHKENISKHKISKSFINKILIQTKKYKIEYLTHKLLELTHEQIFKLFHKQTN
jgi:hypothetical protein